jgi:hypothetical protein
MAGEKKGTASGWKKRDELAALFMQGMLAGNSALEAGSSTGSLQSQNAAQQITLRAYRFADGFLAARAHPAQIGGPGRQRSPAGHRHPTISGGSIPCSCAYSRHSICRLRNRSLA